MQQVIIQYRNPKVLEVLKSISVLLGFKVLAPSVEQPVIAQEEKGVDSVTSVNGVTIIPASGSLKSGGLKDVLKGVDARKLREEAWERNRG